MISTTTHTTLILLAMFGLFSANADPLEPGADAPAPTVTISTGESLDLAELYAEGPVLVYFYPKADTPGCTAQACNLRDSFEDLTDAGLRVVGVSADGVEAQAAFKEKYSLPFVLVADKDRALQNGFGVPGKFVPKRQSFLVVDGKVVWRDLSAKPKTQAAEALAALEAAR